MSTTNYDINVTLTGTDEITNNPIRRCSKHQITIEGSAGDYTIKVKAPNSSTFKDITNGTIDGSTGIPGVIECRAEAFEITPPDGAAYKVYISGLDV